MPDAAAATQQVLLRNRRQQPVELHLGTGVLVLAPGASAPVPAALLAVPQLAWMLAQGHVDQRPVPPPDLAAAAAAAARKPPAAAKKAPKAHPPAPPAAPQARGRRRAHQP
jgi:hypothetical protein